MCKNPVVWLNGWGHLAQDHSKWLAIWSAIATISVSGNLAIAQPGDGTDMRGKETEESARQEADLPSVEEVVNLPTIEVIGTEERLKEIPGSGFIIPQETLYKSHVFTTSEALRKVPGVNVHDEEGFGLRPNIGIRGQNPTRSTKTLLLENGLPLSYAPYGDNASYYHPPVDRFERIEVLKGAGQILFGPQTSSGTINYITPTPPLKPQGFLASPAAAGTTTTSTPTTAALGTKLAGCWITSIGKMTGPVTTPILTSTTSTLKDYPLVA